MRLVLEDYTPYDQSALWQVHDAYYAERGIAAWTAGDVPYAATNNSGVARQHARLLVELVAELTASGELAPDEPVHVLEVGSGHGAFALHLIDALGHGCGDAGKALVPRLRYVLSDYAEKTLEEATAHPALARLVADGTVLPALYDLRRPEALTLPGAAKRRGKRAAAPRLAAVFMNYIACVSPLKVIRRAGDALLEKCVRLTIEVDDEAQAGQVAAALSSLGEASILPHTELLQRIEPESAWAPLELEDAFDDAPDPALHRAVVGDLFEARGDATLNYPHVFLDLLGGLRDHLRPGGLLLVSDFGTPGRAEVQGPTSDRAAIQYGLSLAHDVDFVVLDAFAARAGLSIVRTTDGLLELHTAALRALPAMPASFAAAFERTHTRHPLGQRLLDLSAAAAASFEAGRYPEAARLYEECLRIAPRSTPVLHRYGQACLAIDLQSGPTLERLARRLRRGRRLDVAGKHDFDTLLAGVQLRLGDAGRAVRILERSLERGETPTKLATLALALEQLGERERAYAAHLRVVELDPDGQAAALALKTLAREYLLGDDAPVRWRKARSRS